jgi:CRISPR-associated protein Cas5t
MMCLYLEAPFAVCRNFTAGWYRPSAKFLTPSAAYGLILNIAGIESRLREEEAQHDGKTPASLIRPGLPKVRIAIGIPVGSDGNAPLPSVQTVYQQLHNYPVGKDAGMPKELSKGNKNNITPVRREYLCNVRAILCIDDNEELETRIRRGLAGEFNSEKYGLPFLGDNQFLLDRIEERSNCPAARWFEKIDQNAISGPNSETTRLTAWIDRADMSKTLSHLYAPTKNAIYSVPEAAWTHINPT